MTSEALSISNLSYHYRDTWSGRRIAALHPFSLSVRSGETFGFLGHNGAGKTTTIKNILRLVQPTSGSIQIFGLDNADPESRIGVGYVPENPYFYDYLSVKEAIRMGADLAGVARRNVKRQVDEILERVGLYARASAPLRTLSKGLLQRVAIGQALIAAPRLLILDEPFSGLDPLGRREIRDLFEQQRAAGVTIFMASHILSDVEYLCERVSIMVRGEIKGVFSLADIRRQSGKGIELCIESSGDDAQIWGGFSCSVQRRGDLITLIFSKESEAQRALENVVRNGQRVISLNKREETLESLYLSHVDTATAREEG